MDFSKEEIDAVYQWARKNSDKVPLIDIKILCEMAKLKLDHEEERNDLEEEVGLLQSEQGKVTVTVNEDGECVLVSRQDKEGRILEVIWEKLPEKYMASKAGI